MTAAPAPTSTAAQARTATAAPTRAAAAATPAPLPAILSTRSAGGAAGWGLPASLRGRVGVGATVSGSIAFDWGAGQPGWWLNWAAVPQPPLRPDIPFARMVWAKDAAGLAQIRALAEAHAGNLWLIGNEPDVAWQGNATPEQYAQVYHDVYAVIRAADPSAYIAIGGISQPTPLRLAYLDRVLASFKARYGMDMPVDIWNVHAFVLREEQGSWGVGVPPGMGVTQGKLYEIEDHGSLDLLKQGIVTFRRWMAEHGQREKPLLVTEYGILMPEDYGFPAEFVKEYMLASFDYMLNARDGSLGYTADDNRLVQAFCWYSTADTVYPTSNLFDPDTKAITPLGVAFRQYVMALK